MDAAKAAATSITGCSSSSCVPRGGRTSPASRCHMFCCSCIGKAAGAGRQAGARRGSSSRSKQTGNRHASQCLVARTSMHGQAVAVSQRCVHSLSQWLQAARGGSQKMCVSSACSQVLSLRCAEPAQMCDLHWESSMSAAMDGRGKSCVMCWAVTLMRCGLVHGCCSRRPCAFNLHLLTCAACALLRRCRSLLLY